MELEFTTACAENGYLTAMKGVIIAYFRNFPIKI